MSPDRKPAADDDAARELDDLLARMPLFRDLREVSRRALAQRLTRHSARRGDVLFVEGDAGDTLNLVFDGAVKISTAAPEDREQVLAVLGPGDVFGELALFDPGPRMATATVVSDEATYASLPHEQLVPWLGTQPEAAQLMLRVLARRLRSTNAMVADLISIDVPGRLAKALLELARRFGSPADEVAPGAVRVDHGLTQEELARLVGASRESVNKALADFANRGWVQLGQRGVVLLEAERLTRRTR